MEATVSAPKADEAVVQDQPLLEKYRSMLVAEQSKNVDLRIRRPAYTSGVFTLKPAMQWRQDCIKETTRLLVRMNTAGVSEHEIREINDQINKVLKDKKAWESRIRELGGKVVNQIGLLSDEGMEIPGVRGYRYFGKAKELPGVKELLAGEGEVAQETLKKTRAEVRKEINAAYFGYRDEDDPLILEKELEVEQELLKSAKSGVEIDEKEILNLKNAIPDHFLVPSQKQIELYLISKKQEEMMQYFSK